ncbi:MAG: Eco57I restriction-modification methylase domain-containing protein, partial [Gemmatimonadales bacterium]
MQRLPHISSLEELSQFFAQLGYDPQARRQVEGRRLVARWNAFKVVATMSGNPERDAARIARELRSKQVRGLGVALQPATSLAIAAPRIGVSGVTRVLDVSLAAPTSYELVKLRLLRPAPESNALAHSLRVAEILDSEPAGDRFYTQFKIVYDRFVAEAPVRLAEPDRNLLALLPLTRVLFLYFLQAKTWLDGRPDYVRYQFGRCLSGNGQFHRDVLNRLFFGLLDTPRHLRHSHNLGDIPYLNGGLFRRHRLESRQTEFEFPNDVWREAIDDLFERFQFCAGAADDVDAIAPDMLGRVFERLGAAERGKTGTYYTPEVLVTELVAVSLASALTGRAGLDAEESRKIVQLDDGFNRRRAAEALKDIKIIDPAVGSGAFLLGALELLTKIWSKIHPHAARHAIRRRVLRDNLFGIDVDPQAVKLAELRLWLALVWDDPRQDSSRVEPLPNLDGVIRQGDTLMAPRHLAETPQSLKALRSREAQMCRIRRALFHASGKARQRLAARLHAVQVDLARDLLSLRQRTLESSVSDLVVASSSPDLFGAPSGKHARTLRRLRADLDSIEQDRVLLADGAVPFFSTEIHAPELADRGGFTLVIGNPPWVRAEKLDAIESAHLELERAR